MKSEIVKVETEKQPDFPLVAVRESIGLVVLFKNEREGVVLARGKSQVAVGDGSSWISCFDNTIWKIINDITIHFML
jgi:hypothetical protein